MCRSFLNSFTYTSEKWAEWEIEKERRNKVKHDSLSSSSTSVNLPMKNVEEPAVYESAISTDSSDIFASTHPASIVIAAVDAHPTANLSRQLSIHSVLEAETAPEIHEVNGLHDNSCSAHESSVYKLPDVALASINAVHHTSLSEQNELFEERLKAEPTLDTAADAFVANNTHLVADLSSIRASADGDCREMTYEKTHRSDSDILPLDCASLNPREVILI